MFRASVSFQLGDGATIFFWTDTWLLEGAICGFTPNLFRVVASHRRRRSVQDALRDRQWTRDISGALTAAVLVEYVGTTLTPRTPNRLT